MKDVILNANFPRTVDSRVYHLGIRPGEVANRIVTVGSPSRAHGIASFLDASPKPFTLTSERGFTTITGRYRGTPVSVVSIGMGHPNADFFVREVRECLSGDMVVIRLGSCGALVDAPVGTVAVPRASIAVTRNYNFDFATGSSSDAPYNISKPVDADPELHAAVYHALKQTRPAQLDLPIFEKLVNASTDSFYSSQGRQTSFPDHNAHLISQLKTTYPDIGTLEMETFHIFHLAASWPGIATHEQAVIPPITTLPVSPVISIPPQPSSQGQPPIAGEAKDQKPRIRAAAAQMVFASRTSQDFITPDVVVAVEAWTGRAVLEALANFTIEPDRLHPVAGSVWELH